MNKKRMYIFLSIYLTLTICLLGRIFYFQLIKGNEFKERVFRQSEIKIDLTKNRGSIYDRNNILLTDTKKEKVVMIVKRNFELKDDNLLELKELTNLSKDEIYKEFESKNDIITIPIKNNDSELEKSLKDKKGIIITTKIARYNDENLLTHIIGYTKKYENIGMSGIEKSEDSVLKNQQKEAVEAFMDGQKKILSGSFKKQDYQVDKIKNIKLTIDYDVQKICEKAFDKKKSIGACVVSNVKTGEILSIVSRPNFNPEKIEDYISSDKQELLNKAIQCTYPPGSIFKIIVSLAGFEDNKIDENDKFNCSGKIKVNNLVINCWKREGHGHENFKEAFYNSCNPVFVEIGQKIGAKKILDMSEKMHLLDKVDIGIDEEKKSNFPKEKDTKGNAITNISIGQGDIEVTPLAVNQMTQIIANNGVYKKLYLLDSIIDSNLKNIENFSHSQTESVISPYSINRVRSLMEGVASEGTASALKDLKGGCAGKTGSAQSSIGNKKLVHGWFTGYYPKFNPKYAITVFVYDGKSGSESAVPICKSIIEGINKIKN